LLSSICALCVPRSRASVLPAVFSLLLGILKALPAASAGPTLQALKDIVMSCSSAEDVEVLLSVAMAALSECKAAPDPAPFLRCVALIVATSAQCASHPGIRDALIDAITASVAASTPATTRLQAMQVVSTVFLRCDAAAVGPYIHAWAILPLDSLALAARQPPASTEELAYLQACVRALEALLQITPEDHREGMLAACLPILVALLAPGTAIPPSSAAVAGLQQVALQAVLKVQQRTVPVSAAACLHLCPPQCLELVADVFAHSQCCLLSCVARAQRIFRAQAHTRACAPTRTLHTRARALTSASIFPTLTHTLSLPARRPHHCPCVPLPAAFR